MVTGAMDLVLSGGLGNTAVSTLKLPGVKPGVLLVEGLFELTCPAPRQLQLGRFLEDSSVRVLVDANATDLSGALSAKQLGQLARRVPIGTAQGIVRETRSDIRRLIVAAESMARDKENDLVAEALTRAQALYGEETRRLNELAAVNPGIDPAEAESLESQANEVFRHLGRAQLSLDAIRVAITV